MALTYFNLGDVCRRLAEQRKVTQEARLEYWRDARNSYQHSLDSFTDLRSKEALPKEFADKPNEISGKIVACDAALAKKG